MYSESDLDAAVSAGVLTPQAAVDFRAFVASSHAAPAVDEEYFRLVTGFNDIFVTIAAGLLLVAVGWIGGQIAAGIGAAAIAAVSWGLAEYFTRQRRMALPSIMLLLTFVCGVAAIPIAFLAQNNIDLDDRPGMFVSSGIALLTVAAAYAHWRRFRVPITVAAGAGAAAAVIIFLILAAIPALIPAWLWLSLVAGVAIFAFAMWWDMSDRARLTRRSDVAFWLHLIAAPVIAHSIFNLLGVFAGEIDIARALLVMVLYIGFGILALAIDRRALLVSSLAYVLFAMSRLFETFGAVSLNFAFTALVIGSALLCLSAFWHPIRRIVVAALPADLQARLPALDRPAQPLTARPAA